MLLLSGISGPSDERTNDDMNDAAAPAARGRFGARSSGGGRSPARATTTWPPCTPGAAHAGRAVADL